MRLERCTFHNVGPFDDFTLDLTKVPGELIALVAPNGSGKTFCLETATLGACFRKMATQGSLVGRATARDSSIESTIVYRGRWKIRHLLDGVNRGKKAVVIGEDGEPAYEGTGVREFDAWAERHLPPSDVLRATLFAVQGSAGFLGLGSAERIDVVLQAIALARIERAAVAARKHESKASGDLDVLRQRIADARAGAPDLTIAEAEHSEFREASRLAETRALNLRADVVTVEDEAARSAELARAAAIRGKLDADLRDARVKLADTEGRIRNNATTLAEAEAIKAAVADVERLRPELAAVRADEAQAATDFRSRSHRVSEIGDQLGAVRVRAARAARARVDLHMQTVVDAAVVAVPGLEAALAEAETNLAKTDSAREYLRGQRVAGAEERIVGLRGGLGKIATGFEGTPRETANETLAADDLAEAVARDLPGEIKAAQTAYTAAFESRRDAEQKLRDAREWTARVPAMTAAAEGLAVAERELEALEAQRVEAVTVRNDRADVAQKLRQRSDELAAALAAAEAIASKAGRLAAAEGRIAELEPQAEAQRQAVAALEVEAMDTPPVQPVPPAPDVARARAEAESAERVARTLAADVARAEQRLEQAKAVAVRVADLDAQRVTLEAELADWTRLALDCGREGIQSAEVDSAGPELTELTNDLLRACHGPRYTVSIETKRAKADGKGETDECRVMVIDTVAGTEKEAREHSGGEKVVLGEAISLALTMLACRRAGLDGVTLIRDESGAALDPSNARTYVAMLRRAAKFVHADKVVIVSHSKDVVDLCDAVIRIPTRATPNATRTEAAA